MKTFKLTAYDFVGVLRKVNSMNLENFSECFGRDLGDHYYRKFTKEYSGRIDKFVFYLDNNALENLITYKRV